MSDFRRSALAALTALALAGASPQAFAQVPEQTRVTAPGATLAKADRDAAYAAIVERLKRTYVFPEKTPQIIAALDKARAAGRYDVDSPSLFTQRITEDLNRASGDGHLYLTYDPERFAATRKRDAAPVESADADAFFRAEARRNNHGIAELRILPGNVRYLKISAFYWIDDETGAAYDAAMRFLHDGDAVIIDVRGNGGGSDAAVRYAISHFVEPQKLLITFLEAGKTPTQSRALDNLPAGRMKGKPLYVLADGRSASAAEEFAYHVRQFKLGELVGQKTAGGANNNELFPIAPGFMLSVSYGRPVHPVGEGNWEGAGVLPTVPAEIGNTLETAEALALTRLAARPDATPLQRAEYEWARVGVEAQLKPPTVAADRLQALAGKYGDARAELRDGRLWLQMRPNGTFRRLSPLSDDGLFAIEGNDFVRVRFAPDRIVANARGEAEPRVFPKG